MCNTLGIHARGIFLDVGSNLYLGMRYYVIAGEKSGDLHASNLMKALGQEDPDALFRFWGGDEMAKVAGPPVKHIREMAFMGIWEVVRNLGTIRKNLSFCQQDLLAWKPDVLILVDYAGFNLRMAKFAKQHGIRVFYYISPKIWAWNQQRALKIKAYVDRMFVIMHFEKEFYRKFGIEVDYVGNPLFDAQVAFSPDPDFLQRTGLGDKPIVALLPGSRYQEVFMLLPDMLSVVKDFPDYQFVVAGVDSLPETLYDTARGMGLPVLFNETYDLLQHAQGAIVTSGTATLETALFNVPQVVVYKANMLLILLGKMFLKVPYISLVNLIASKPVVQELIQWQLTSDTLKNALQKALVSDRGRILEDYANMRALIQTEGVSATAARKMVAYLKAETPV